MKSQVKFISTLLLALFVSMFSNLSQAQERDNIQYYAPPSKSSLNVFEAPFTTDKVFDGVYVRIGGSNTLQFQGLTQENDLNTLTELQSNFNLATSNLDLDVALAPGMRMHLRTYLSSQHHSEAWVKSGYMQIDSFDFIEEGFLSELSDKVRIKVGHMEINYGDNHFRRSDNGQALMNPFVGNYIMDSFTTEVGAEVYYFSGDFFGMVGATNGHLNQTSAKETPQTKPTWLLKLGYDSQINEDVRFRLTGSVLTNSQARRFYLYSGDRAGSRYYNVANNSFRGGRFAPNFTSGGQGEVTAFMINPFLKMNGLEIYGVLESVSGQGEAETSSRSFTQLGAEVLYRFGMDEDFYIGGRYNSVTGETLSAEDIDISRINIGGGWFMTENVMTKIEYVSQSYDGFAATSDLAGAEFSGIMLEAVISF